MNSPNPEQETNPLSSFNGKSGLPRDMKIVLLWTALCIISIYTPVINQSFIRIILALPQILFIPGYVLLAALFPDSMDIDAIERIVLSIGTSIVITPLIGLCLNFTSWGIRLDPLIISLTLVIIVLVIIAQIRRTRTSPDARYTIPVPEIRQTVQNEWAMRNGSRRDRILFYASIFAIGLVVLSTVLVITLPKQGEKFSEFFILGENRTADSYPRVIVPDISYPMYVGIGNHEFRTINYSVEIYLVPKSVNETIVATSQPETILVKTYSVTLSHNESSVIPFDLIAPDSNYNRVDFLLFDEKSPGHDITGLNRVNASYRNLHLGFNVTPRITDFFILGENRTAAAYPEAINSKTPHTVYVGVGNHEFRMMNYTVEMYLAPQINTKQVSPSRAMPQKTYTVVLNHNETSILPMDFSVPFDGNYRMDFLLFNETVPSQSATGLSRVSESYHNVHLGFNATSPITEFFILGENRTAAAFPEAIIQNTPHTVYVGVGNHEFRRIKYSVETYLVPQSANESAVASSQYGALPLKTYTVVLNHNEISILPFNFSVSDAGNYRMDFLVFNETVPSPYIKGSNRVDASYRNLYLGFNVTYPLVSKNTTEIR